MFQCWISCTASCKTLSARQTEEGTAETITKAIEKKEVLKELNIEENAMETLKHSMATCVKMQLLRQFCYIDEHQKSRQKFWALG